LSFNKLLHTVKADIFWHSSVYSTGSEGSKRKNVSPLFPIWNARCTDRWSAPGLGYYML